MKLFFTRIPSLLNNKVGFYLLRKVNPDFQEGMSMFLGCMVIYDYPVLKSLWKDDSRFQKWDALFD